MPTDYEIYQEGKCHVFALALYRLFHWQLVTIRGQRRDKLEDLHVVARYRLGYVADSRGIKDDIAVHRSYMNTFALKEIKFVDITESEAINIYQNYGVAPVSEHDIQEAIQDVNNHVVYQGMLKGK
jgi:hypothetical protein